MLVSRCQPSHRDALRISSHHFRVLLLRRLRFPFPLVMRTCRCGRPLDSFGHHCAACSVAGMLGRGGLALESASRRTFLFETWICSHRMCMMAEGWKLWQIACHCLVVHSSHWTPHWCRRTIVRPRAAHVDGVALTEARRRKERDELVGLRSRAKLVVLAGEVGGRLSAETTMFLRLLAAARARCESALLRRRAEQAWRMRWGAMLACAAARAFAASLLEQRSNGGGDGDPPSLSDVLSDFRHAGLRQCGKFEFTFIICGEKNYKGRRERRGRG